MLTRLSIVVIVWFTVRMMEVNESELYKSVSQDVE